MNGQNISQSVAKSVLALNNFQKCIMIKCNPIVPCLSCVGADNRPLSLGSHVESRGIKSLALFSHGKPQPDTNSVRGLPCKKKAFFLLRLNMAAV